jgi:hypothetical protein
MWGLHDLLMVSRVRELMADGMPMKQAIHQAEKFIANYRVPASVGEGGKVSVPRSTARFLSRLMQDRTALVFGRYHYNKLRAIGATLRDAGQAMTRSGMSAAERTEVLGRLSYLLIAATVLPYGLNFVLQQATGNPQARVHTPGALGVPANMARVGSDLFRGQWGDANWEFWMSMLSIWD